MPNYAYRCPECEDTYEKTLTIEDMVANRHCCPKCGATGNLVIASPAIHMKLSPMHPRAGRGRDYYRGKSKKEYKA